MFYYSKNVLRYSVTLIFAELFFSNEVRFGIGNKCILLTYNDRKTVQVENISIKKRF